MSLVMTEAQKIEAVIFDWGGVLIDEPGAGLMEYCSEALGISKEGYIEAHRKFIDEFERGSISEEQFWVNVCEELIVSQPKANSLWAEAFEVVYSPKEEMFSLARQLRGSGYKTAVLSNTEPAAMEYFLQQGYDMFDVLVFSCVEGLRKPEREIYQLTLERLGVEASRAVFIDDRQVHIAGAQEAGLHTILFEDTGQVKSELGRLGVEC